MMRNRTTAGRALTLRGVPTEVLRGLRLRAQRQGTSVNRVIVSLLEQALGIRRAGGGEMVHTDLDALAGSWTGEEAREFEDALRSQRAIDPELWR